MKEKRYIHKHINKDELIYKYCILQMPATLICKQYGVSSSTIYMRLKYLGIERRDKHVAERDEWLSKNHRFKYHIDDKWLINEYVGKLKPQKELAREVGCNVGVIYRRLKGLGIYIRSMGESKKGRKWSNEARISMKKRLKAFSSRVKYHISKEDLYYKYIELGMSCCDIAKELGCVKHWVGNKLREYDIPIRTRIESQNMPKYIEKLTTLNKERYEKRNIIYDVLPSNPVAGMLIDGRLLGHKWSSICIWVECPDCGKGNWRELNNVKNERYGGLCVKCVNKNSQHRGNIAQGLVKTYTNPDIRKKLGEAHSLYIKKHPEYREKMSINAKLKYGTEDAKKMMRERSNKYWRDPIYGQNRRIKQGERHSGNLLRWWGKYEYRKLKSSQTMEMWANPEVKDILVSKIRKASNIRPNKVEDAVIIILNELYPNEWKYVGNGEVVMGGKNPDIINIDGRKAIIEVNGMYWHGKGLTGECPLLHQYKQIDHYRKLGYETLVIWEQELKELDILCSRINGFYNSMQVVELGKEK